MCQGRFYREEDFRMGWHPLGPGDDEIWIETEEDKETEQEVEQQMELEFDVENEIDKENK